MTEDATNNENTENAESTENAADEVVEAVADEEVAATGTDEEAATDTGDEAAASTEDEVVATSTDEGTTAAEGSDSPAATELKADPVLKLAADARYSATGKRKTAVARVILKPGKGNIEVNGRDMNDYFPRPTLQVTAREALVKVGSADKVDVVARVHGGGVAAQAGAVRHGIAKALLEADENLRGELKRAGFLTRDARVKERKKAGLKKARKRPQFSKR